MTSEVILYKMCLHNVSTYENFHQNWFINECANTNFVKIRKDKRRKEFFVRCSRTVKSVIVLILFPLGK